MTFPLCDIDQALKNIYKIKVVNGYMSGYDYKEKNSIFANNILF